MCIRDSICALFWTIRELTVCPTASSGLRGPSGATGVVFSNTEDFGIWDSATTVQDNYTVDIVFANTLRTEVKLHPAAHRPQQGMAAR